MIYNIVMGGKMKTDLDIIIPCYNAKDTLFFTLSSINIQQGVEGFKVYLINDKSDYDYQDEVRFFSKNFYIEEIKLKENVGPGGARREGILRTNSKFIMFIDSDDVLYYSFAIRDLYNAIKDNDLCISNFILERDGVKAVKKENAIWLHGKLYRREFLEKYNINFNNTRANEDNGFNRLILLLNPKIGILKKTTYVYRENSNSITRKNNRNYKIFGLEGFIYNMTWAIDEALKRNANTVSIPFLATTVLISMYYDYLYYINDKDANYIIKFSKGMLPYYLKYPKIPEKYFNYYVKAKEKDLRNEHKKVKKVITFDEFLQKVVDIND